MIDNFSKPNDVACQYRSEAITNFSKPNHDTNFYKQENVAYYIKPEDIAIFPRQVVANLSSSEPAAVDTNKHRKRCSKFHSKGKRAKITSTKVDKKQARPDVQPTPEVCVIETSLDESVATDPTVHNNTDMFNDFCNASGEVSQLQVINPTISNTYRTDYRPLSHLYCSQNGTLYFDDANSKLEGQMCRQPCPDT